MGIYEKSPNVNLGKTFARRKKQNITNGIKDHNNDATKVSIDDNCFI